MQRLWRCKGENPKLLAGLAGARRGPPRRGGGPEEERDEAEALGRPRNQGFKSSKSDPDWSMTELLSQAPGVPIEEVTAEEDAGVMRPEEQTASLLLPRLEEV